MTASTAQNESILRAAATFPATIVGVRWELTAIALDAAAANCLVTWAIVHLQDSKAASALSLGDATDFYSPEQNVISWGTSFIPNAVGTEGPIVARWNGDSKTMRKVRNGDQLVLLCKSDVLNAAAFNGIVQFFIKS